MAHKSSSSSAHLPAIGLLFSDTWGRFVKSLLPLLLLTLAYLAAFIVITLLGVLLVVLVGFATGTSQALFTGKWMALLSPSFLTGVSSVGVFLLLVGLCLGFVFSAARILTIANLGSKKSSFMQTIGMAWSRVGSLFLLMLFSLFFVGGSMMLFFLPGLFVAVFFIFALYEVVLEKQGAYAALGSSMHMVSQNFWAILGRVALLWLIMAVYYFVIQSVLGENDGTGGLAGIFNILIDWFALCYIYTLYKQVAASRKTIKSSSLLWVWVVAILGWVLFTLVVMSIVNVVSSPAFQQQFMQSFSPTPSVKLQMQ